MMEEYGKYGVTLRKNLIIMNIAEAILRSTCEKVIPRRRYSRIIDRYTDRTCSAVRKIGAISSNVPTCIFTVEWD